MNAVKMIYSTIPMGDVQLIDFKKNYEKNLRFVKKIDFLTLNGLDSVVFCLCYFDVRFFSIDLYSRLNILYPQTLKNAVVKRQAEYLAGRYTAMLALKKLDIEIDDIPIGLHRSPVWPVGVVGSITHISNIACSAVGNALDVSCLGVDKEAWIPSVLANRIKEIVICNQEEEFLKKCELGFNRAFTLAFSAKESLFKALYPRVGRYFDFSAASIDDISMDDYSFELCLRQELTSEFSIGRRFKGYFTYDANHILTAVSV